MFNTKKWIADTVRTSSYINTGDELDFSNFDLDFVIQELKSIKTDNFNLDSSGTLLPARYPRDIALPPAILDRWDTFTKELCSVAESLNPAVKHMVLSMALSGDDLDIRSQRLDAIKDLFIKGQVYQPDITWTSLLKPEWFDVDKKVTPVVRGGSKTDELKGVSTTLSLNVDKIRVNPANLFGSKQAIKAEDAYVMEQHQVWIDTMNNSTTLDYPLVTSLWAYALGDKKVLWNAVTAGAALYSPFYTDSEVDALVVNQSQRSSAGYYFRPGNGISDIYPLADDPVLSNYFNIYPLFEASLSTGSLCAIKNLVAHPGSPVGLSKEWGEHLFGQVKLMKSMDLIPSYSAFSDETSEQRRIAKKSAAFDCLEEFAENADPSVFDDLLIALLEHQGEIQSRFEDKYVDAADFGYPASYRYIDFENRLNNSLPQCVIAELEI